MTGPAPTGQASPLDATSDFNRLQFTIRQVLSQVATATLVQVQGVTNDGGVAPVGFVDVLPLVKLVDGNLVAMSHRTIYHLPYLRLQGGSNAIIIDPVVGDIGLATFADHDISAVVVNKAESNPGSSRRFDLADGLYLGGYLGAAPEQYFRFSADGLEAVSPVALRLTAPTVEIDASSSVTVNTATATVTASDSITFDTPTATFTGDVQIDGGLNIDGTVTGTGGTLNINAAVVATGEGTFNGHTVGDHTHISAGPGSPTSTPTG